MSNTPPVPAKEIENFRFNLGTSFDRGVDLKNRIIRLTEDIDDHHFDWIDAAMTALEDVSRKKITIKINSYGGDVYTALAIVDRIRESKCTIETRGYGKIMSASTAILAAGHRRYISKYAIFMDHSSSYAVEGTHDHIMREVKAAESLSQTWCKMLEELTRLPAEFWAKKYEGGLSVYLTPEQCVEFNIVDEVF
jgi:ATP-dependent Clp protease protease subunit